MSTSRVIKIDDDDNGSIQSFSLKQFTMQDTEKREQDGTAAHKSKNRQDQNQKKRIKERVIQQAQLEAQQLKSAAAKEAEQIERDAYQQGFRNGEQAALKQIQDRYDSFVKSVDEMASEYRKQKQSFYSTHQDMILELALKISRKVIHHEVSVNRELVTGLLHSAIQLAVDRERLKIRINPSDMDVCIEQRPHLMQSIDGVKHIVFEPDEAVGRGGAIIEYALGEIDARLDKQFEELELELRNAYRDVENLG